MSHPIPTKHKNRYGLHQRYNVEKIEGETDDHVFGIGPPGKEFLARLEGGESVISAKATRQNAVILGSINAGARIQPMNQNEEQLARMIENGVVRALRNAPLFVDVADVENMIIRRDRNRRRMGGGRTFYNQGDP